MTRAFIKKTCSHLWPCVPLVQKYDTNHRHDAQSAQGNLLFALGVFLNNNIPLKNNN